MLYYNADLLELGDKLGSQEYHISFVGFVALFHTAFSVRSECLVLNDEVGSAGHHTPQPTVSRGSVLGHDLHTLPTPTANTSGPEVTALKRSVYAALLQQVDPNQSYQSLGVPTTMTSHMPDKTRRLMLSPDGRVVACPTPKKCKNSDTPGKCTVPLDMKKNQSSESANRCSVAIEMKIRPSLSRQGNSDLSISRGTMLAQKRLSDTEVRSPRPSRSDKPLSHTPRQTSTYSPEGRLLTPTPNPADSPQKKTPSISVLHLSKDGHFIKIYQSPKKKRHQTQSNGVQPSNTQLVLDNAETCLQKQEMSDKKQRVSKIHNKSIKSEMDNKENVFHQKKLENMLNGKSGQIRKGKGLRDVTYKEFVAFGERQAASSPMKINKSMVSKYYFCRPIIP